MLMGRYIFLLMMLCTPLLAGCNDAQSVYEDFNAPRENFKAPLILDIPIDELAGIHEQEFSLPLRRKYGVFIRIVSDGGIMGDTNSHLTGDIKIVSLDGKEIFTTKIPYTYELKVHPSDLLVFDHRNTGGLNQPVKLVVSNLKLVKSSDLENGTTKNIDMSLWPKPETFEKARLLFIIKGHPVVFD